ESPPSGDALCAFTGTTCRGSQRQRTGSMTAAVRTHARATTRADADAHPADVFVIFGITGDLAKVMTFRSLYRLERRGLLNCPIIGVAVDDWSPDDLREHARAAIQGTGETLDDAVFERFIDRCSYLAGDFGDADTFERLAAAMPEA